MGGLGEVQHSGACEVCGHRTNGQAVGLSCLGASIALDGAGIWPNLPISRCIFRMQTYFQ